MRWRDCSARNNAWTVVMNTSVSANSRGTRFSTTVDYAKHFGHTSKYMKNRIGQKYLWHWQIFWHEQGEGWQGHGSTDASHRRLLTDVIESSQPIITLMDHPSQCICLDWQQLARSTNAHVQQKNICILEFQFLGRFPRSLTQTEQNRIRDTYNNFGGTQCVTWEYRSPGKKL